MTFHTCACTCSHLQRPCTHRKDALCMPKCFWSPPLERLLVVHTVILSSRSFVLWLHAQDKGFRDQGAHILTPYLDDSLSMGSWLFYLGISWECEQEPESLRQLHFKNEARTMSGQYLQSASWSVKQWTYLLKSPITHFVNCQHLQMWA